MSVTVRLWPSRGCPNGLNRSVSKSLTTACSADVDLHAVAMRVLEFDTVSVMDYVTGP